MNIIILTEKDETHKNYFKISDERFNHIRKILKSEVGDIIEVGLLLGATGTALVSNLSDTEVELQIVQLNEVEDTIPKLDLICALPRPQTLKKVLNISATMGVQNIYLIRSEKVEKSYFHSPLLEEKNYIKYLIEGLSQGKRTDLPNVTIHKRFKDFFITHYNTINKNSIRLLAHPDVDFFLDKISISDSKQIALAIGPEGGWNDYEVNFMIERGFQKFKLSKNILRVESAVTSALSQIELLTKK